MTAQFYSPAEIIMIDLDDSRLAVAKRFGATATVNSKDGKAAEEVMEMTGGRGVDAAIEAVGVPATFELCQDIVAPGGTIANIGVHGVKADLHLERLWSHNIAITTRLVDTVTTPMLLKTVRSGKIDPKQLITHHFTLDQILDAYDTFGRAATTRALKVLDRGVRNGQGSRRPRPRPALPVRCLEGGDALGVTVGQVDVVPAVEQLIAADRIDAEGEAPVAARDRLLLEIDPDGHVGIGRNAATSSATSASERTAVNSPFFTAFCAKMSPKDGAITQRMPASYSA